MAKKVLGRGLGDLLPERRPDLFREGTGRVPVKDPSVLSPGLRALVVQEGASGRSVGAGFTQNSVPPLVHFALLLSDVLIVTLTVCWRAAASGGMSFGEALACVLILGFASWLGCFSAWLHFKQA